MAGWQDAPIVSGGGSPPKKSAWQDAPVVGAQPAAPVSALDKLPPETSPGNQPEVNHDTIANKILGIGEAGLSTATGAAGGVAGQLYGAGKALTGGRYGSAKGSQEAEAAGVNLANKLTYQPRTQTGQQLTETIGKVGSALQGLPPELAPRIPELPRAALATGEGAAAGARAVGKGAANVAAKALPEIDQETAQLARQAHQMGFRLTPDQVMGGKYSKIAGEGLASVPLSGSNATHNQATFLRNLSEMAGIEGGKPTRQAFATATSKVGKEIGALNKKYDVPIDRSAMQAFRSNGAGQLPAVKSVVNDWSRLISREAKNGVLPGSTFRKLNTQLGKQIRSTTDGDLKYALGNLQDDLLDLQSKQMGPEDTARLNTLRKQYAIQRTIEPLAAKSPTGEIAPSALLGALTSTKAGKSAVARGAFGDVGNLADIGSRFLKEPKSSGTAERRLVQGIPTVVGSALGAGAGVAGGAATLPAVLGGIAATGGAANLYNRFGPAVTRAMIDKPPP